MVFSLMSILIKFSNEKSFDIHYRIIPFIFLLIPLHERYELAK